MSNFRAINEQLSTSWKKLRHQWNTTKQQWKDKASHDFEINFMQEFEPAVGEIVSQLNHLDEMVTRAKREIK